MFFNVDLKKTRLSLYFTQAELCTRAKIPLGTYKNWERGRQLPSPKSWKKLRDFLDTTFLDKEKLNKLERTYINDKARN